MNVLSVAWDNISRATATLDNVAARIATLSDPEIGGDTVDLSSQMVQLMEARSMVDVNIAVLKTANEMSRNLVDLIA